MKINLELISGLPEDYGTYLFLMEDGSIKQGYYSSFPFPYHQDEVRIANCEDEEFHYYKVVGWLQRIE